MAKVKSHPVINFPMYFLRTRIEVAVTDFATMSFESSLTLIARDLTFHIYSLDNKTADGVKMSGPVAGSFQCSLMKETSGEEPMAGVSRGKSVEQVEGASGCSFSH